MSTCCSTDITINAYTDEQKKGLEYIAEMLKDQWLTSSVESPKGWLGHIIINSGIGAYRDGFVYDKKGTKIGCRGHICSYDWNGEQLTISDDDANGPYINMWARIRDKYASGAELIYSAQVDCEDIRTNDVTLTGLYYIDIWDNNSTTEAGKKLSCDTYFELPKDKAIKMLNDYFNTTFDDIESVKELAEDSDDLALYEYIYDDTDEECLALNNAAN